MIKFLNVLRFLCVGFVYLFLLNGIKINSGDVELLYISSYIFRYVLMGELLYFLLEVFVPYLFKKLLSFMRVLFPKCNKNV